jgi:hypothetical protein
LIHIVTAFKPECIILIVSHAYGALHDDQDVDLLSVMALEDDCLRKAAQIRRIVRAGFAVICASGRL